MLQKINFLWFSRATIIAVYLLILVGGIVRSTGSGMGCPDWPKCFGRLIPPTHISELPANYKEIYAEKRRVKNKKIASYLGQLGYHKLANKIIHDPNVYIEQTFNPTKTWIEYINRLLGAVIGLFILFTSISAIKYIKKKPSVFWLSLGAFILVFVQAWIGSVVVSTNLIPGTITLHMLLSIVLLGILIYAGYQAQGVIQKELSLEGPPRNYNRTIQVLAFVNIIFSLIQVLLGTRVRETVDTIAHAGTLGRDSWIGELGEIFIIHRSYSWFILALNIFLIWAMRKNKLDHKMNLLSYLLTGIIIFEILIGALMAYFSIPAFLQPLHLFLAVVMMGIEFSILLLASSTVQQHEKILKA